MLIRRRLIIVGAGDFAPEVLWLAGQIEERDRDWAVGAFLDDTPDRARQVLQNRMIDLKVLGTSLDYQPLENDCFALAIGSPEAKLSVAARLLSRGARFINLTHPTLSVMQHARIGTGCIFMARTNVGPYAQVGDFVTINNNSGVAHDTLVEDGVTLSAFCDVTGRCILRRGAFLGSHAALLPGTEVGEFAVVGAGSVPLKKVKARTTVFGVPAREIC